MPSYTFQCSDDHVFDLKLRMTDPRTDVKCPVCGAASRRKIQSAVTVHYNGTGFASTDIPRKSGMEGYVS
jgi:putative FmdB family regulatory protein